MGQEIMKQYITNRIQKCPIHDLSFLNPSQPSHPPTTTIVTLKTTGPGTNKNTNKNKMNNITSVPITPSPADIVAEKDGFSKNEIEQFSQMLTSPRKVFFHVFPLFFYE
jgi:hypothetical protein